MEKEEGMEEEAKQFLIDYYNKEETEGNRDYGDEESELFEQTVKLLAEFKLRSN